MHRIRRTYADKGIKVLLLPSCHMPSAATPSHALPCSLLMHTCIDALTSRNKDAGKHLMSGRQTTSQVCATVQGFYPWWHCHCVPADDKLGVQAGLH